MSSPTQRSLDLLRKDGYLAQITEHWNMFAHIRQDLFGFIDIVAIKPGEILAVQTTSRGNTSARIKKIMALSSHEAWLASGGKIQVHGWGKMGKKGKVKHWTVSVQEITS